MLRNTATVRSGGGFSLFGCLLGAAFAAAALAVSAAPLMAQQPNRPRPQQQQQQAAEPEEIELEQIELKQSQIDAYVTAQTAIKPITAKLKGNIQPTTKMLAQMEAIAKQAGFKDLDEFGDVGSNIEFVFGGIEPQSKKFSEPEVLIGQDIAKVNADTKLKPAQKKRILEDLQQAQKSAPKLRFPGNAELVAKNYDRLKPLMEEPAPPAPPARRQR